MHGRVGQSLCGSLSQAGGFSQAWHVVLVLALADGTGLGRLQGVMSEAQVAAI